MNYQSVYPDVYYKVQPFVMMACDEMDAYNMGMPTYDMVRQVSDQIHDDVMRVHPDLMEEEDDYQEMSYEAAAAYDMADSFVESQRFRRRRGFFRDLIDILLLNEFFRRRRF
ncbi:MAG TPA: hypothetical protein VN381_13665 [Anaerovoracaceae bacterium]|nr:hypothetical protein [Anaerovoracaceae bacterium]